MAQLLNRTHYSVLQAFNKPIDLVLAAKKLGHTHVGLCDFGTLSAAVDFVECCQNHGIIPIIGCDLQYKVFARNLTGWYELISLVNNIAHSMPIEPSVFQSENLIFVSDEEKFKIRFSETDLGLRDCRYIDVSDEESYRILRAMANKTTITKLVENTKGYEFPSEIVAPRMSEFLGLIEPYSFFTSPKLPGFAGDKPEIELLRDLVEIGFSKMIPVDEIPRYRDRLNKEMKVIELNNLAGYFLIVQDFCNEARQKGVLVGAGRGSASGCLVSYLTGITLIDPLPYGLLFSRFFNAARSYPKHLSFDECPFVDVWRDVAI
jgi:DNA polymerase III alpha subunit